jgi:serine/threonine protein kinase/WD40 repeat protein
MSGRSFSDDPPPVPPFSEEQLFAGKMSSGDPTENSDVRHTVEFVPLRIVGEGGMGIVYRALQKYPERIVALKVFKGTSASPRATRRFEREIAILARLHHRGIAHLYGVGKIDLNLAGQAPFMALEFIEGDHITTYADARHLNAVARIELMIQVCEAMAYAHRQGVVHRDLKPANILIDGEGIPKVLDFGLATLRESPSHMSELTEAGDMLGTFAYASPEQACGLNTEVDAQTDVYALGAILYELLTGSPPHKTTGHSWSDIARRIDEDEPPRIESHNRAYAGDLDTIVSKALAREKIARYGSVDALTDDLRRFIAHQPILARPPTLSYRASKFVRRNRILVTAATLLFLSLSAGIIFTTIEAYRADREATRANQQTHIAQEQLARSELAQGDALQTAERYDEARVAYDQAWDASETAHISPFPVQAALWELNTKAAVPFQVLAKAGDQARAAVCSVSQGKIVLAFAGGRIEIRDLATAEVKARIDAAVRPKKLLLSPNEKFLAVLFDKSLQLWDLEKLVCVREFQDPEMYEIFVNDSEVGVQASDGFHLVPMDPQLPDSASQIPPGTVLAFVTPDTVLMDSKNDIFRCVLKTGECQSLGTILPKPSSVVCSADGGYLAAQTGDICDIYECASSLKKTLQVPISHRGDLQHFATSNCLFFQDQKMDAGYLVDLHGGTVELPQFHEFQAWLSPHAAISENRNGECVFFLLARDNALRKLSLPQQLPTSLTISSDGAIAAFSILDGQVSIVDCSSGRLIQSLKADGRVAHMRLFDKTQRLALTTEKSTVEIWNLLNHQKLLQFSMPDRIDSLTCSETDEAIVVQTSTGSVLKVTRNAESWSKQIIPIDFHATSIALNSQGTKLFVSSQDHAELWNLAEKPSRFTVLQSPFGFSRSGSYVGQDMLVINDTLGHTLAWNSAGQRLASLYAGDASLTSIVGSDNSLYVKSDQAGVQLRDANTHMLIRQLLSKSYDISVNGNGDRILARTQHDGVSLLDLEDVACLHAALRLLSTGDGEKSVAARTYMYGLAGLDTKPLGSPHPLTLERSDNATVNIPSDADLLTGARGNLTPGSIFLLAQESPLPSTTAK